MLAPAAGAHFNPVVTPANHVVGRRAAPGARVHEVATAGLVLPMFALARTERSTYAPVAVGLPGAEISTLPVLPLFPKLPAPSATPAQTRTPVTFTRSSS